MNITELINSTKELNDLPFLVVFRTIQVLREQGWLIDLNNVDRIQH